jgi:hypothetical protein
MALFGFSQCPDGGTNHPPATVRARCALLRRCRFGHRDKTETVLVTLAEDGQATPDYAEHQTRGQSSGAFISVLVV